MVNTRAVLLLSAGLLLAMVPRALAQVPSTTLAALGSARIEERRRAADGLSSMDATGPDAVDSIGPQLAAFRQKDGADVLLLMNELRHGRPKEGDFVELLLQQQPDAAVVRALATLCLMRALAHVGTVSAVRRLVLEASDAEGAFRPELFRVLKELDERASAALIEVAADPSPEMRAWAKDVLEALGRRTPADMVQTSDDQILVDVLRAYGAIRDIDAVPVVLSFVTSARAHVRAAAREATLAYGADAAPRMRAMVAALTGDRPPNGEEVSDAGLSSGQNRVDTSRLAHALFDACDHQRLRDVYAHLDMGLGKKRSGDIEGAIVDLDDVLAREPLLDRRAEIVPAYVTFAEGLESTSRVRALEYLRRALRLDDSGAQSNHVRSEILRVKGEDLETRGIADSSLFEEALALDPQNAHARSHLDRLRADARARRTREDRISVGVAATGVALLAIGAIALLAHQRRRRGA